LLSDPSLFTLNPADLTHSPAHVEKQQEKPRAKGFSAQLRDAAQRRTQR
jgi:hypothetical protein